MLNDNGPIDTCQRVINEAPRDPCTINYACMHDCNTYRRFLMQIKLLCFNASKLYLLIEH